MGHRAPREGMGTNHRGQDRRETGCFENYVPSETPGTSSSMPAVQCLLLLRPILGTSRKESLLERCMPGTETGKVIARVPVLLRGLWSNGQWIPLESSPEVPRPEVPRPEVPRFGVRHLRRHLRQKLVSVAPLAILWFGSWLQVSSFRYVVFVTAVHAMSRYTREANCMGVGLVTTTFAASACAGRVQAPVDVV